MHQTPPITSEQSLVEMFRLALHDAKTAADSNRELLTLLSKHQQSTPGVVPNVEPAALLAIKLFRSADPDIIRGTGRFLEFWRQNTGKLVAVPNPIAPHQWLIGIYEGVDLVKSQDSFVVLKLKDNRVVVIDTPAPNASISTEKLDDGGTDFGFTVYFAQNTVQAASDKITTQRTYHPLARENRLFCIAAHLLNAAEQVPSDLMERAIADALQASTNLQKLTSDLIFLQAILKVYQNRPSINPQNSRVELAHEDIMRVNAGIERLQKVYPEIPLLGTEPTDDDPDSGVRPPDPKNTAEIIAVFGEDFGGDLKRHLRTATLPLFRNPVPQASNALLGGFYLQ